MDIYCKVPVLLDIIIQYQILINIEKFKVPGILYTNKRNTPYFIVMLFITHYYTI